MKKHNNFFFYPLLFTIILCSSFIIGQSTKISNSQVRKNIPKNIIFIIADGMGPATFTATRIWAKGSSNNLNMEKMPYTGYAKTYSGSNFVTDSAASATALASGVKTYNGSIGLSYDKLDLKKTSRPLESILTVMKAQKKSTGIITTTRVTHATPACFYAHAQSRILEREIAFNVQNSPLDLLMGGGRNYFYPRQRSENDTPGNSKEDERNILEELKQAGWDYIENKMEMNTYEKQSLNSPLIALFNDSHMTYETKRIENKKNLEPSLLEMTEFAINFLSDNKQGFFLMIEAGRIDHASHGNDISNMLQETLVLDQCVGKILSMPLSKETLVVITADHETGGLAISGYGDPIEIRGNKLLDITSDGNNVQSSHISWATGPNHKNNPNYPSNEVLHPAAQFFGVAKHTAIDVMVLASGPGAPLFTGFMNNTEIPRKMLSILGLNYTNPVNDENPISL